MNNKRKGLALSQAFMPVALRAQMLTDMLFDYLAETPEPSRQQVAEMLRRGMDSVKLSSVRVALEVQQKQNNDSARFFLAGQIAATIDETL